MTTENGVGSAVRRLVDQAVLTEAQYEAVVAALAQERARPPLSRVLAEIAAYAGAGLLFGGIGLVFGSSWDELARLGRFALLAVITAVLVGAGLWAAGGPGALFVRSRGPRTARYRLASALFALTSVSVAGMVAVLGDEHSDNAAVLACLAGLAVAALGYAALPSVVTLLAAAFFSPIAVAAVLEEWANAETVWTCAGVLVVGGVWFALTRLGVIAETWAGYLFAIVISVIAAQSMAIDTDGWSYAMTAVVAVVCFVLYVRQQSLVLVIGGGIALAIAITEAVADWTENELAAAVTVVVLGIVVLATAAYLLTRGKSAG